MPLPFAPLAVRPTDVDAWRSGEAEGFGDLDEVKAVDVEDAAQAVRCVGLEVRTVTVFGRLKSVLAVRNQVNEWISRKLTLFK